MKIILASGSPRRRQLLEQMGISFDVVVSDADETISGAPQDQVAALSARKAAATAEMLRAQGNDADTVIIAADTLVALGSAVLGNPANAEDAFVMLKSLQGRKHTVYTGVTLLPTDGEADTFVEATDVFFRPLTDAEIHAYIDTGEPFDKAGAYGIQEKGALLVARVEGDFYTVMGLPLAQLWVRLAGLGAV